MTVRKKRPVLYEVIRPEHHRGDPAQPPIGHRPQAAPPPVRKVAEPPVAPPHAVAGADASADRAPVVIESDAPSSGRTFAVSGSTLTVIIASFIILIFVVFVAGKQFGSKSGDTQPESSAMSVFDVEGQKSAEAPAGDAAPRTTAGRPGVRTAAPPSPEKPRENPPAVKPKESAPAPAPAPGPAPTVALQKGYTYIVVQHFNKSKRADAEAAAEFLRGQGVGVALQVGADIRLIATEGFLIEQRDAAAAERERRRAGQLQQRIKELGRQYDKTLREQGKPSYTFAECYPSLMK